jgi:hypothetical protein
MNENSFRKARDGGEKTGSQLHIISEAFACDLRSRGYATSTIGVYRRIVAHFAGWLSKQRVRPRDIRSPHIDSFLRKHLPRCHCAPPVVRNFLACRGALHCFLSFLRRGRWIPRPPKTAPRFTAIDRLLVEFEQHLDRVQGLSVLTRRARGRYARELLEALFGRRRLPIETLQPGDCIRFVNTRPCS